MDNTQDTKKSFPAGGANGRPPFKGRGDRGPRTFADRPKPEFDQKIISIRRVTRVVSGGRRMSFAVALAIGDKKGSVGMGTGKAGDTALAINKALRSARKQMIKIKTTKDMSIPYDVSAKFSSAKITIMPNRGKGLVAGSTARDILTLAGLKNVTSKLHSGSKNRLNNGRAVMAALAQLSAKKITQVIVPEITPTVVVPETLAEVAK